MDLKLKLKLTLLLMTGNTREIKILFSKNLEGLKTVISKHQIKKLTYLANNNNDVSLLRSLLYVSNGNLRKKIIKRLYDDVNYVSYCKEFELFLADFLEFALENDKKFILCHLAKIVNKNPKNYVKEIKKIREYFLKSSVDETVIAVSLLECFKSKEFDFKIIDSGINNIFEYIEDLPIDNLNAFLQRMFKRPVYSNDIRFLAKNLSDLTKLERIIHFVIKAVNDKRIKSECLYAILEEKKNFIHHEYLVKEIINLNVLETLEKLVNLLNVDEVIKYVKKVLNSENMDLILNFALILENELLIDKVIRQGSISDVYYLVINIKTKEVEQIFKDILLIRGSEFYINLAMLLEEVLNIKVVQTMKFSRDGDNSKKLDRENSEYLENNIGVVKKNLAR